MARCMFMRHHCTKRRKSKILSCSRALGLFTAKSLAVESSVSKLMPGPAADEDGSDEEEYSSGSDSSKHIDFVLCEMNLMCGPSPSSSNCRNTSSSATSLLRLHKYSKNCFLVTAFSPSPAMRPMSTCTTSGPGAQEAQCASNPPSSEASMTPSPFASTRFHSSSNFCQRTALSSSAVTVRLRQPSSKISCELAGAAPPPSRSPSLPSRQRSKSFSGLKLGIFSFWTSPLNTSMNQSDGFSLCGISKPNLSKYAFAPNEGPK
mmetsp:Transcript_36393/g.104642  ORF Transcript_36393/g.104642 Transcript_36393/m.104642 type:complete len:262 (-) Transcript_36393:287-1072(-)